MSETKAVSLADALSIQETNLTEVASAIREKRGMTGKIYASQFAEEIRKIDTSLPALANPGAAADLRSGKQLIAQDKSIITGSMPNAGAISGKLGTTADASWSSSDPNRGSGKVSITGVTQTAGYTGGYSNGTLTVDVPANRLLKGRTVTPTTIAQTIANAEDIAYGAIQVAGDANLIPANIVSGKSIFGVSGTAKVGMTPVVTTQTISSSDISAIFDIPSPFNSQNFTYFVGVLASSILALPTIGQVVGFLYLPLKGEALGCAVNANQYVPGGCSVSFPSVNKIKLSVGSNLPARFEGRYEILFC